jgi:hypothetical protein
MSLFAELADVMSTMTPDHVVQVCQKYAAILKDMGAVPFKNREDKTREGQLNHLAHMCNHTIVEIQGASTPAEVEKAMRWLGFIQGGFWALEIRTIDQMREDNR